MSVVLGSNDPASAPRCGLDPTEKYPVVRKYCVMNNLCSGSSRSQACPGDQGSLLEKVPLGSSLGEQTGLRRYDHRGGRYLQAGERLALAKAGG